MHGLEDQAEEFGLMSGSGEPWQVWKILLRTVQQRSVKILSAL